MESVQQVILVLKVLVLVAPIAVYFMLLGLLNSQPTPRLINARSDFLILTAALCPLLGLLGTVTAMIAMFRTIAISGTGNPALTAGSVAQALVTTLLGIGMAVALITTLYGAIVSNVFFLPFAEKLGFLNKQELLAMEIIIRGIMAIQSGDNPRVIEQKLTTFLPPKLRAGSQEAA